MASDATAPALPTDYGIISAASQRLAYNCGIGFAIKQRLVSMTRLEPKYPKNKVIPLSIQRPQDPLRSA
jgi:hypothetical protein